MVDEWSGFAALLANLIEKYALVLNLDALPDLAAVQVYDVTAGWPV